MACKPRRLFRSVLSTLVGLNNLSCLPKKTNKCTVLQKDVLTDTMYKLADQQASWYTNSLVVVVDFDMGTAVVAGVFAAINNTDTSD